MNKLSVILCTYNPDSFSFGKCIEAVSKASEKFSPFEIIIIDNNSSFPVVGEPYIISFLQRNANARVVTECQQGLTPARLRGIRESAGSILLFIDDDNWIYPDFFSEGMAIAANYPHIGSWSGQVKLQFEKEPESWTKRYWGLLVHREFDSDRWSNLPHLTDTMPCGAGLFVRKVVADHYESLHSLGKREIQLDRKGSSLLSAGDNDLAACACDIGLGVGLFYHLVLDHYIPTRRLSKEYLLKLAEDIYASAVIFKAFRNEFPMKMSLQRRIANIYRGLRGDRITRSFFHAVARGEAKGRKAVEQYFQKYFV